MRSSTRDRILHVLVLVSCWAIFLWAVSERNKKIRKIVTEEEIDGNGSGK